MDEYLTSLISNSQNFIGGRTLVPGPMAVPLRGTLISPNSIGATFSQSQIPIMASLQHQSHIVGTSSNPVAAPGMLENSSASSILRADMSHMINWLRSQNNSAIGFSQSHSFEHFPTNVNNPYEAYEVEAPRIPKPYIELTPTDCAGVVAKAIRSIILHTCNDEFRQQCFSKLGVSSSHEVEKQVRTRLIELIIQEEQQQRDQSSENQELDESQGSS